MDSGPETPNPVQQIMQVATGYIASSALYVAVALNVADHLSGGARRPGANGRGIPCALRPLWVRVDEDHVYKIAALCY